MSNLLDWTAGGGHPVNVQVVGLEVEPLSIRRIEHVTNSIGALGQPLPFTPDRWHSPELKIAAGIGDVDQAAAIRRPDGGVFIVSGKGEFPCLVGTDVETGALIVPSGSGRVHDMIAVGRNRKSF